MELEAGARWGHGSWMVKERTASSKLTDSWKPRRKTTVVLDRIKLKAQMERKSLTVDALADLVMRASRSGADKQRRVRDILAGENPRPKTVNEFARVLGIATSELIDQDATFALHREIDEHNRRVNGAHKARATAASESISTEALVNTNIPEAGVNRPFRRWQLVAAGCLFCALLGSILWRLAANDWGELSPRLTGGAPNEQQQSLSVFSIPSSATRPQPSLTLYVPQGPSAQRFAEAFSTALGVY